MNKVAKIAVVSVVALAAGLYLSGYFFLFHKPSEPSPYNTANHPPIRPLLRR